VKRLPVVLALVATALAAAAIVLVPVLLLWPFRPQTPAGVEAAYRLREASPLATPVLLLLAAALFVPSVRVYRRWYARVLLALPLLVAMAAAYLARQNHFEWMFNPLPGAGYARASEAASFVDPSDMLIAVELRGDAVAYPVRQMAYHHLLNDQVGGIPVVSTY
jgi:hypothetical protein